MANSLIETVKIITPIITINKKLIDKCIQDINKNDFDSSRKLDNLIESARKKIEKHQTTQPIEYRMANIESDIKIDYKELSYEDDHLIKLLE